MTPSDSIEETAPTVDEAVRQALAKLGAQQDDVTIEVLSTPRAGVLGLGVRQARVRVTRRSRTMVFMSGELVAGDRILLVATGLWKIVFES